MRSETSPLPWNGGSERFRFAVALACAAILEAAAAGGLLITAGQHRPVQAGDKAPMRISIQVPPAPPAPPPLLPAPPVPVPPAVPVPMAPPLPQIPPTPLPDLKLPTPLARAHRMRQETPRQPPAVPRPTVPVSPIAPPRPPAPPRQPAQAAPSANEQSKFEAALRQAVQASLIFPAGAQAAHEHGLARVRFRYRDGIVSDAVLLNSSGFPVLDNAALQTVRGARYPAAPGGFAGRSLAVDVDVVFRLRESDMESD